MITLQDGQFCPTSQPAWSAYREPTFGHGEHRCISSFLPPDFLHPMTAADTRMAYAPHGCLPHASACAKTCAVASPVLLHN